MDGDDPGQLALACALTSIAGYVDAIGFMRLGHLFVSFMSGDSTQLAVSAQQHLWPEAAFAGSIVAYFVVGVAAGHLLARLLKEWRRPIILALEAVLLGSAGFAGAYPKALIILIVVAMGLQNAAVHKKAQSKTGLTYVTGTLVSLGERLADAFCDPETRWGWLPYLLLWAGLVVGAMAGALAYRLLGTRALLLPSVATAVLALIATGRVSIDRRAAPDA